MLVSYNFLFCYLGMQLSLTPSPTSCKTRSTKMSRICLPSPAKRSLFSPPKSKISRGPTSTPSSVTSVSRSRILRKMLYNQNGNTLRKVCAANSFTCESTSEDEEMNSPFIKKLPFSNYCERRDSGCLSYDENTPSTPMRKSTVLEFNSCSSGDENNSDSSFSSPIKRRNKPNFVSPKLSPASSSGVSCCSPVRSPPDTPPHTRKLRALTLFDTPSTPKTLMRKLCSRKPTLPKPAQFSTKEAPSTPMPPSPNNSFKSRSRLRLLQMQDAASPLQSNSSPFSSYKVNSSGVDSTDDETDFVIMKGSAGRKSRLSALRERNTPSVNVNPFTPDNRPTPKRKQRKHSFSLDDIDEEDEVRPAKVRIAHKTILFNLVLLYEITVTPVVTSRNFNEVS